MVVATVIMEAAMGEDTAKDTVEGMVDTVAVAAMDIMDKWFGCYGPKIDFYEIHYNSIIFVNTIEIRNSS